MDCDRDYGLERLELPLPAVISVELRLNQPRPLSLINIMKAKAKPLEVRDLESLGLSLSHPLEVKRVSAPPSRAGGIRVASVAALLEHLDRAAVLPR